MYCVYYKRILLSQLTTYRCTTVDSWTEKQIFQPNNGSRDMRFSVFADSSWCTLHYEQCSGISRVSMPDFRLLK